MEKVSTGPSRQPLNKLIKSNFKRINDMAGNPDSCGGREIIFKEKIISTCVGSTFPPTINYCDGDIENPEENQELCLKTGNILCRGINYERGSDGHDNKVRLFFNDIESVLNEVDKSKNEALIADVASNIAKDLSPNMSENDIAKVIGEKLKS